MSEAASVAPASADVNRGSNRVAASVSRAVSLWVASLARASYMAGPVASDPHRRSFTPRENCSRSSGVIWRHRSIIRCRPRIPRPGPPNRPNRIRLSTSNPRACQNVIRLHPKIPGINQFHRPMITAPSTATATTENTRNFSAFRIHFRFMSNLSCLASRHGWLEGVVASGALRSACVRVAY